MVNTTMRVVVRVCLVVILLGTLAVFQACKGKGKGGTSKPTGSPVGLVTPSDNSSNVPLDTQISVEFNRPMDNATVNRLNFMLVDTDGKSVLSRVSYDGKKAVLATESPLDPERRYKAVLSTDIKDISGTPLSSAHVWMFTTEMGVWNGTVQFGGQGDDQAEGLVMGSDRFLYVAGNTSGSIDNNVNANAQGSTTDVFVAKLSPRGTRVWVRQFGVPEEDFATAIAVSRKNEVYVVGYTEGDLDTSGSSQTGHDVFTAKYNAYGNKEWIRQIGPGHPVSVAVDDDGNAYVAGYTGGHLDGQQVGFNDAFLIKYAPDGTKRWVKQFGTRGEDYAVGVIASGKDEVYVLGWSAYGTGPGGVVLPIDGKGKKWGVWLALFGPDGTQKWVKKVEESGLAVTGLTSDVSGNIYAVGYSSKSRKGSGRDIFVLKCSKEGEKIWTTRIGVGLQDMATSVSVSDDGAVIAIGHTSGSIGTGRRSNGSEDVFAMAFSANGERKWTRQYGTEGTDFSAGSVYDHKVKGVVVVGHTTGSFEGFANKGLNDVFLLRVEGTGGESSAPKDKR